MGLDFQTKRKSKGREFLVRFSMVVLAILIVFIAKASWGAYKKEMDSSQRLEQSMKDLSKLEDRKNSLSESIEDLETEKGVEALIREKFRVAKEGEGVIVVLDQDDKKDAVSEPEKSWWQKMFSWW